MCMHAARQCVEVVPTFKCQGEDNDRISQESEKLKAASHKLAEEIYRQASAQAGGAPGSQEASPADGASGSDSSEGDVIDAEVVDTDGGRQ